MSCPDEPPAIDNGKLREWPGSASAYGTTVRYFCDVERKFSDGNGGFINDINVVCAWNRSWTPATVSIFPRIDLICAGKFYLG